MRPVTRFLAILLAVQMRRLARTIDGLDQDIFARCMADRMTLDRVLAADEARRDQDIDVQPVFQIGAERLYGV